MKKILLGTFALLAASSFTWASIIFDDFNSGMGVFNQNPTYSSTTANVATTSTTTWDTTASDLFEGAGVDKVIVNHVATASSSRVRWLSGLGTPANNTVWTFTGANDGYIGLYVKTATTATGWTICLNMDSSANTGATMASTSMKTLTTDGQWHLYEWAIDPASSWVATQGIGGPSMVAGSTHTFDSIYFYDTSSIAANNQSIFYVDFVALNPNGSIANLVPEPSTLALALLGGLGLLIARRRR